MNKILNVLMTKLPHPHYPKMEVKSHYKIQIILFVMSASSLIHLEHIPSRHARNAKLPLQQHAHIPEKILIICCL